MVALVARAFFAESDNSTPQMFSNITWMVKDGITLSECGLFLACRIPYIAGMPCLDLYHGKLYPIAFKEIVLKPRMC